MKILFSIILISMAFSFDSFAQAPKPKAQQTDTKRTTKKDSAMPVKDAKEVSGTKVNDAKDATSTEQNSSANQRLNTLIVNQQLALQRLELLMVETGYVDSVERQVILLVKIADVLWPFDLVRAKQQFKDAFSMIDSIEGTKKNEASVARKPSDETTTKIKDTLRQDVLRIISSRDVEFADTLAQSIAKSKGTGEADPSADQLKDQANKRVIDLRLSLAMAIAESDPERAAAILNDTLQIGIQSRTMAVLVRIRQKKPELADTLFTKIVVIADENPEYYSYDILRTLGFYIVDHGNQALMPKQLNQIIATQLLRFAYKVISYQIETQLTGKAAPATEQEIAQGYVVLQQLSPLFERFLPEEAIIVKTRLKELSLLVPRQLKDSLLPPNSKEPDSVKNLLAQASITQNFNQKDDLLMRAAILSARQGNIDEGLMIADKLNNSEEKKFTSSLICSLAVTEAISSKDLEKAYKYAKEISDLQNRVEAFSKMMDMARANKEPERVKELLNEIARDTDNSNESHAEKAWCLYKIAEMAVKYDLELATQYTAAAIRQTNSVDWEKPVTQKASRYKAAITMDRFRFDLIFTPLARSDFENILGMATTIEKKDLSILAQLAACRAFLEKPYDKAHKSNSN